MILKRPFFTTEEKAPSIILNLKQIQSFFMKALFKSLLTPILSLIFLALSHGLFTTFVAVRLEMDGCCAGLIGLAAACFNGGILAGAFLSPRWAIKLGCSRTLILLYAANTGIILLHALWIDAYYWMGLRFIAGIVLGAFFTVMESWFLKASLPTMRSQALSLYLIAYYIAVSSGQLLLAGADPLLSTIFFLAAALSAAAAIPLAIGKRDLPASVPEKIRLRTPAQRLHLGFFGGIASGVVIASIYGLGPIYGKTVGLTIPEISVMMAVTISGGFLFQWPIGKWGDASGHSKVLKVTCFAAALLGICLGALHGLPFPWLLLLCCLFGGASFSLYPLSLAYVCEDVAEERIPNAAGKFVAAYGLGAILGPLATSLCIEVFGGAGLFYFLASICALSGLVAFLKPSRDSVGSA